MNIASPSDTLRVCEICGQEYAPVGWAQRRCKSCGIEYDHQHRRDRDKKRKRKRVRLSVSYSATWQWRLNYRLKQFELSREQYEIWELAGCVVCGRAFNEENVPHIDHDHRHCTGKTGCIKCVRGLLCSICNRHFISAVENNPHLRFVVTQRVLD